jgi:pimeloyl-ACP methyl ester carboxylesterase
MTRAHITFISPGIACSAWHFRATSDLLAGQGGRPVVVMAHGFGGTKDSGLEPFAERIASAGADVFAFDYRGFGASEGQPRQTISIKRQVQHLLGGEGHVDHRRVEHRAGGGHHARGDGRLGRPVASTRHRRDRRGHVPRRDHPVEDRDTGWFGDRLQRG